MPGLSIIDVTFLGRGVQGFCDNSTKDSIIKSVTIRWVEMVSIISNFVTSFMDDLSFHFEKKEALIGNFECEFKQTCPLLHFY